jgi:hypothetical protein
MEGIERVLNHHFDRFLDTNLLKHNLKSLMRIILEHNIFEFADKMYKQVCGTAMGTKFAPSFANIFMASI